MDLHRLRVVVFNTSASDKADEKKYIAGLEKYEQGDWKTSSHRNNDNQYRNGSKSPPRRLSNKCLSTKIPSETSKVLIGNNSRPPGTSVKKYLNDKITRPGTSKKCRPWTSKKNLDDISITSPLAAGKKRSFTIRKSKSEIFKISPKKKPIKYDLKFNLSDTDPTEQYQDNAYSHQRKRTLSLRKRNSKARHKVENTKEKQEKNDVHFLFTRETPSFMRFCRKRAKNEKTKTKNKRNSRLPNVNDIYGFHKVNRSMDQHLYQMSCFKCIDTDKLPFKKIKMGYHRKRKPPQPVEKCFCKHHAMRVLKSDCRNCENPSIFYNLDTRPHHRKFQRNYDNDQEQGEGTKMQCLQCMGKDEVVEVSRLSLDPVPCPHPRRFQRNSDNDQEQREGKKMECLQCMCKDEAVEVSRLLLDPVPCPHPRRFQRNSDNDREQREGKKMECLQCMCKDEAVEVSRLLLDPVPCPHPRRFQRNSDNDQEQREGKKMECLQCMCKDEAVEVSRLLLDPVPCPHPRRFQRNSDNDREQREGKKMECLQCMCKDEAVEVSRLLLDPVPCPHPRRFQRNSDNDQEQREGKKMECLQCMCKDEAVEVSRLLLDPVPCPHPRRFQRNSDNDQEQREGKKMECLQCMCKDEAVEVSRLLLDPVPCPHPRRFQRNSDNHQEQREGKKKECLQCMGKDEAVEVSPSSLGPVLIGFCDAGTSPSNVKLATSSHPKLSNVPEECSPPETATVASEFSQMPCYPCLRTGSAQNKCKKEGIATKTKVCVVTNGYKGFFSRLGKHIVNFHSEKKVSGAGYIKYVCVGLLIVIWFPCLLAGVLTWVVLFPGKLINLVKCTSKRSFSITRCRKKDPRSEYERMCFENYLPQQKRSFMSSVARWCKRTVGVVVNSLNAIISVFQFKRKAPKGWAGSSCLPPSPNPRKRYTLFYVSNRGWLMKPLRRRKKHSLARSRVVQNMRCDFIPKMSFENWQQTPSKDAFYISPAKKIGRQKRRRSSRAGDAYQLHCTDQWPSCTCRNKSPSQVNILYNKKKYNSNVLADYIAQEDLAKNHLDEPKNGARPFGFDINYPFRTKHPLIINWQTYKANQFGLAGKTVNMSTKITPRLGIKGSKVQLPKCRTRNEVSSAISKACSDDKIDISKDFIKSMQSKYIRSCKLNKIRTQTINRNGLNCPRSKNRTSALTNKKLCSQRTNHHMRNKSAVAALSKSALMKDAHTSTHKINYTHKAQNILKHIPYWKVINKCNKMKNSNPVTVLKRTPKQVYKYSVPSQKYLSPAKIKSNVKRDTVINSSFENIHNHSKQDDEYKPHHRSIATQKQVNTTNTWISADHNKALHSCRHNQYKQDDKYTLHRISATHKQSNTNRNIASHRPSIHEKSRQATHKQSNTSDIMAKVKCNMALISPHENERSYQTRHIPVATQMKPDTANNMTMTSRDILLEVPRKQYKQGYRYESRHIQMIADHGTMTSHDIASNCLSWEKHDQFKHTRKYERLQTPVATEMQLQKADNRTMTNQDVALNCPSWEKYGQFKHTYKYQGLQIPFASQIKSQIAEKVTMTSQDIALNCPSGKKHEQSKQVHKYKHQIPVATKVHPNTADITKSTFCDSYDLDAPFEDKHEQYKQGYRYEPRKIGVATQMKSMKVDNITMTSRDVALICHGEVKRSTATKEILCIPRASDKNTSSSKLTHKCVPTHRPIATKMQSNTAESTTMTSRDIGSNYLGCDKPSTANKETLCIQRTADKITVCTQDISSSKSAHKCVPDHRPVAIQKESNTIDITTMTSHDVDLNSLSENAQSTQAYKYKANINRDIASNYFGGVQPSTVNKELLCIPKIAAKGTIYPQKQSSLEVHPKRNISSNSPLFGITSDCRYDLATQTTQISRVQVNRSKPKIECKCWVTPLQNKANKETTTTHNTQPKLTQVPSHTFQEQPKSFGVFAECVCKTNQVKSKLQAGYPQTFSSPQPAVSEQSRKNIFQTTPLIDTEGLTSAARSSHQNRIVSESPTSTTDIHTIPCVCKCTCNTIPHPDVPTVIKTLSKAQLPQHLPSKISQATNMIDVTAQPSKPDKKMEQIVIKDKTHKISSSKQPPGLKSKRGTEEARVQPDEFDKEMEQIAIAGETFGIANNCVCGDNHVGTEAQGMHPQSRYNNSQTTPFTKMKALVSDPVAAQSHKTRIMTNNNTSSTLPTNLEELPCDCKCECRKCECRKQSSQHVPKTTLGAGNLSVPPDISKVNKTMTKSLKSPQHLPFQMSHATSRLFGISSDCRCEETPESVKGISQLQQESEANSKKINIHKTSSPKEPPIQKPLAIDCTCGTDQAVVAEKSLYNELTGSKYYTEKETQGKTPLVLKKSSISKFPKTTVGKTHKSTSTKESAARSSHQNRIVSESPTSTTDIHTIPCVCKCTCNTIPHPDVPTVIKTLSKAQLPQHLPSKISQATNMIDVTAQPSKPDKKMEQIVIKDKTHKISSSKQPPGLKSKRGTEEARVQPDEFDKEMEQIAIAGETFGIANNCVCGDNHVGTEAQGMHPQSRYNNSQTTPFTKMKALVSDPVAAQSHKTRIMTNNNTSSTLPTNLEELPCDCKCECRKCECRKQSSQHVPKTTLGAGNLSVPPDISKVNKTMTKSLKSPQHLPFQMSHATSRLFGISSDCRCEETPESVKGISQLQQESEANSKKINIHKTSSPKEPPIQKPLAIDCTCGTDQAVVAEKSLYNELTGSKYYTEKETQGKTPLVLKKSSISKFPKTTVGKTHKSTSTKESRNLKSKRRTNKPKMQSDTSKVIKCSSKFPKSPKNQTPPKSKRNIVNVDKSLSKRVKAREFVPHPKNLLQRCPCPVEDTPQRNQTPPKSKRNIVNVDKSLSKRVKAREFVPHPKNLLQRCPCPVEDTPQSSRISIFNRNSKRQSSHLDERCFESGIPVAQSTARRAPTRDRPEYVYSVDKTSLSQLQPQCSKESQYLSSVNSLVKNVRSSLFSRKLSKQGKLPKYLKSSQSSTLSPYLSKTCHCPISNREKLPFRNRKSKLSDESNCLFRQTHGKVKPCLCQVNQVNARKPSVEDKSSLCLQSVSKHSLRSSKMYRYLYPRVSQRIVNQQSKTSEHSSILISENKIVCTTDDTSSTPKDGMPHQILKTLFLRNSHSNLQQLLSQRNIRQYFAHSNRSQKKLPYQYDMNNYYKRESKNVHQLSEKKSLLAQYYTMLPGMCKCAKEHLGKTINQHFIRSQESTPKQKQPSKNIQPQYFSSQNTDPPVPAMVPSKYTQNPEPLKSKRSSFNLPHSKQLIDKIRSITDIISTNSRKNKQEKRSNLGVQTAPIISGKCACWPEKLHQITKKKSHYSRKPAEKILPSQQPPSPQATQPYKNFHQPKVATEAHTVNPQHLLIRQPSQLSQLTEKVGKPFDTITQQIQADQAIAIIPGRCRCVGEQKIKTKHSINQHSTNNKLQSETDMKKIPSSLQHFPNTQPPVSKIDSLHSSRVKRFIMEKVEKQLDQLLKTDRVLPIIPGRCRCAGEQKIKTEHSSKNKLQPNIDLQKLPSIQPHSLPTGNQRFKSPTVSHNAHKATLQTDKQPELTQRQNQPGASKLSQPHTSQHTGIIHNAPLHNSQPTRKKSCKCRSFKHKNEQEVLVNSLHTIAKTQSPFHKYSANKNTLRRQHIILQRSEILCGIGLKKSQNQSNPQNEQILRDQKPVPDIPLKDKPPPELLQRYSTGDGRKRTAEGGVQQPYPEFDLVSMRYPGQNASRKQSGLIPGINSNPPTNIQPSCGTCYTNPASRCAQQQLPDYESALRRAYKRRPLRYTPPKEQLPKVCSRKKNQKFKTVSITEKQMKKWTGAGGFFRCLRDAVHDAEQEAWPNEVSCHPMYLSTLKQRPCFWLYNTCPRAYPAFLGICKWMGAIRRLFAFCVTFCFWSPLVLCFYLCCNVLFCSSCS